MNYRIYDYDLWAGDEPGTLQVNDFFDTDLIINIPDGAEDTDVIKILRREGILKPYARIQVDNNVFNEDVIYMIDSRGNPSFELRKEVS